MILSILVDMNLSPDWVGYLRQLGYDCVHWSTVGDAKALDTEIMTWARSNGRTVMTHDLDFGSILALTHAIGPSVIQLRCNDPRPQAIGPLVESVLCGNEQELKNGALIVVDVARSRVRLLPI